jgi:hypothetical protein
VPTITKKTAERALIALAHAYRESLSQYGIVECGRNGVSPDELDRPGSWININGRAVAELWKELGGPEVGDYVLAREADDEADGRYRRYRIVGLGDGVTIATAAWSGADERGKYSIDLATAIYTG